MFMTCVVYMSCRSGVEEDMQQSSDENFDLPPPTLVHTPHPSMSSSSVDLIDEEPDLEIEETEDAIVTHVLEQSVRECDEVGR